MADVDQLKASGGRIGVGGAPPVGGFDLFDSARLFIFTDRQHLLVANVGEAGVTIQAGRSHADVPYQCDSHPADVAATLLGTVMKGTL